MGADAHASHSSTYLLGLTGLGSLDSANDSARLRNRFNGSIRRTNLRNANGFHFVQTMSTTCARAVSTSPTLNLAKSIDSTHLARQLLYLVSCVPSLNLVIRLMFCLNPPNDDWDLPEFPILDEEGIDTELHQAYRCLSRPIADDISLRRYNDSVRGLQKLSN
ncbi:hypothetical protein V8B97DRAFT_1959820 [Scleroderma yunnanense]